MNNIKIARELLQLAASLAAYGEGEAVAKKSKEDNFSDLAKREKALKYLKNAKDNGTVWHNLHYFLKQIDRDLIGREGYAVEFPQIIEMLRNFEEKEFKRAASMKHNRNM